MIKLYFRRNAALAPVMDALRTTFFKVEPMQLCNSRVAA